MKKTKITGMYNVPFEGLHNDDGIINTPWLPYRPGWWNDWGWRDWEKPEPTYVYRYIEKEPEEKSQLVKDYCEVILTDEEKLAVKMGAMDDTGILTPAGKELLIELFNDNKQIQKVFYDTLKEMKGKKNGK